jgi:hypothetical protein
MALEGSPAQDSVVDADSCETQNQIESKQTVVDGCPVLPKMQCHEVLQGQDARLLWDFKDAAGDPVDLTLCSGANCGDSTDGVAFDEVGTPPCGVSLRLRELSGYDTKDLIHEVDVEVLDADAGQVRAAQLPDAIMRHPGIYQEEWALFTSDGRMLSSNRCVTFVNRGLFGIDVPVNQRNLGPPTIQEIRLGLRDNASADNVLIDDVEFDAAEISQAVLRPIQYWNEIPPPIRPIQTTKTFPFREMWMLGIQAYLLEIASHNYRRNQLSYSAGGVSVDDKNKEQPYAAASARLIQRFQEMCRAKKVEINISLFSGSLGSPYGGLFY